MHMCIYTYMCIYKINGNKTEKFCFKTEHRAWKSHEDGPSKIFVLDLGAGVLVPGFIRVHLADWLVASSLGNQNNPLAH